MQTHSQSQPLHYDPLNHGVGGYPQLQHQTYNQPHTQHAQHPNGPIDTTSYYGGYSQPQRQPQIKHADQSQIPNPMDPASYYGGYPQFTTSYLAPRY
jgi:hypothetical protein